MTQNNLQEMVKAGDLTALKQNSQKQEYTLVPSIAVNKLKWRSSVEVMAQPKLHPRPQPSIAANPNVPMVPLKLTPNGNSRKIANSIQEMQTCLSHNPISQDSCSLVSLSLDNPVEANLTSNSDHSDPSVENTSSDY